MTMADMLVIEDLLLLVELDEVRLRHCPAVARSCFPLVHFRICEHTTGIHACHKDSDLGFDVDVYHFKKKAIVSASSVASVAHLVGSR